MSVNDDTLFGRFVGQSKLKQGDARIRLTPDANVGATASTLGMLTEAVELEGSFGIVSGERVGDTLFEASVEEVVPPILSGVLDQLLKDGVIDPDTLLPRVHKSIKSLVGRPRTPSTRGKPLCALVVGHRKSARGAVSSDQRLTEFDFNSELASDVKRRVAKARVKIVFRDNTPTGRKKLPAKINALGPRFILSLHCNAFNKTTRGTETLFFHTSSGGKKLAKIVQKRLLAGLKLKDRRIRSKKNGDRGAHLLKFTEAPCVICEPFFIDNDDDLEVALRLRKSLAVAYASAIDEAAEALSNS